MRAIAFDAYGTLFDVFSVTTLCEELFPGRGDAVAQLWRAKQLQYSLLSSMMDRYKNFWELTSDGLVYAARSLQLPLTDDARDRLMESYLRLAVFPDVTPCLQALKARGLSIAILSNGAPEMLRTAVTSAGIGALVDDLISADEVKVFKPHASVYGLLQQHLGLPLDQLGFVSSNSWDINGAGAAGLHTFWIQRRAGEPEEELGFPARSTVRSLTDLDALIP